jgi:hypothetical protein
MAPRSGWSVGETGTLEGILCTPPSMPWEDLFRGSLVGWPAPRPVVAVSNGAMLPVSSLWPTVGRGQQPVEKVDTPFDKLGASGKSPGETRARNRSC